VLGVGFEPLFSLFTSKTQTLLKTTHLNIIVAFTPSSNLWRSKKIPLSPNKVEVCVCCQTDTFSLSFAFVFTCCDSLETEHEYCGGFSSQAPCKVRKNMSPRATANAKRQNRSIFCLEEMRSSPSKTKIAIRTKVLHTINPSQLQRKLASPHGRTDNKEKKNEQGKKSSSFDHHNNYIQPHLPYLVLKK
jgi:hypothetical protein